MDGRLLQRCVLYCLVNCGSVDCGSDITEHSSVDEGEDGGGGGGKGNKFSAMADIALYVSLVYHYFVK